MFLSVSRKTQMLESGVPMAGGVGMAGLCRLGVLALVTPLGVLAVVSLRREFRLDLSFVVSVLLLSFGALASLGL